MVKDNLSKKLVSRCAAAALALIITVTGLGSSDAANTSDPAIGVQAESVETTQTTQSTETKSADETVAFSMTTFKASQGAYSNSSFAGVKTSWNVASASGINAAKPAVTTSATTTAAATTTPQAATTTKSAAKPAVKATTTKQTAITPP